MPSDLIFRSPCEDDIDAVTELEMVSFRSAWKQEFFESELNAVGRFNLVVEDPSGALVGYLFTMYYLDEMHVNKIAVAEDWRRFGIASSLMAKCFEFARSNDVLTVSLEARESNDSARALYSRLGFDEVYVRQRYYSDGESAVVMTCRLTDGG